MTEPVITQTEDRMRKAITDFEQELKSVRTGRASASLLDNIRVDYHGTPTPVNQVASISTPDPTLIVIQPWESSIIPAIEKAIRTSDLGINPGNDGKVIRLPVPPLTEERRRQLVKNVGQMAEQHRVAIRQVRQTGRDTVQKLERDRQVSEDDARRAMDRIQDLTQSYSRKIDELAKKKEADLMKV